MVSQRSSGSRPPTVDQRTLARARNTPTEPPTFPRELSRCQCGTASFQPDDHANGCPLGPTRLVSTNPIAHADQRPEWQRGF